MEDETIERPQWLLEVMRRAPRLSAVIRRGAEGVTVELSDGRRRFLERAVWPVTSDAVEAAVSWARRHGAGTVQIDPVACRDLAEV